jgi:hypothetical protein
MLRTLRTIVLSPTSSRHCHVEFVLTIYIYENSKQAHKMDGYMCAFSRNKLTIGQLCRSAGAYFS